MPRILSVEAPSKEGATQHAFIAIPSYGPVPTVCVHSLWAAQIALREAGIRATLEIMSGNCHVDDARNHLVRDFLDGDYTDLVFIDSDLGFDPVDLVKLLQYDRPVVAGIYPMKQAEEDYPIRPLPGPLQADADGLIEVMGVPTGFLRIKRYVLKELAAKALKFKARSDKPEKGLIPIIFERTFANGSRFSGDYSFCEKWRNMAGEIYIDPGMNFEHVGENSWCGGVGDFWKRKNGVYESQLGAWLEDLKAGNASEEVFTALFKGWGNNFAATPELLATVYDLAKERTGAILETGSGLTSLVMAIANPNASIHCLEHDPIWAIKTREACDKYGIKNVVIHCHALKDYGDYLWYDTQGLPEGHFEMVLCDGPPRSKGSRKGLFLNCAHQINGGVVVMDDVDDSNQLATITAWSDKNGRKVKTLGAVRPFALSYKEK